MRNVFVQTENWRKFTDALSEAEEARGAEPVLVAAYGQAGRGKTSAARKYAADHGWAYVRAMSGWSELWMLQDVCRELGVDPVPSRKKACFEAICSRVERSNQAVLLDEADKLSEKLLEWVRDMADVTSNAWALVGERELIAKIRNQRLRRIWSRVLRVMEFGPITVKDVLFFAKESSGILLSAEQGVKLQAAAEGDFRLVARDVRRLEKLMAANNMSGRVTDDYVDEAIRQGLRAQK
jgi:hypothetical protein